MECIANRKAFVSLKDHKDNFNTNPKCRLINPAKSEIGLISKIILQNINNTLRKIKKLNQWGNTASVISWFNNICNKQECKFMKFDIVDFYPSISENLLNKCLEFATKSVSIKNSDIKIIRHARKSVLFDKNSTWIKRGDNNLFDVTMGSYDGAEIWELVGLFLLEELEKKFGKESMSIGLYRDDGLAVLRNMTGRQTDKARKEIQNFLKIIIWQSPLKQI